MSKHVVYKILFGVIAIRFLLRLIQEFRHLNSGQFADSSLWMALGVVLFFHSGLVLLFWGSAKFKEYPAFFLYINFVFFLYLLSLLSGWAHLPAIILMSAGSLVIGAYLYWPLRSREFKVRFVVEDILIVLWLAQSFLLFIERDLMPMRQMYQDEGTFWAIAARKMVEQGIFRAHLVIYPGGGLHPLGIPFLTALPLLVVRTLPAAAIFFMPCVVIIGIFLFLNRIKHQRWVFLFFLTVLFAVFNNRSWIGCLMYQMVYAEGISSVILLWFTYEILNNDFKSKGHFILGAFLIGLLALTKSPLTLTVIPFLAVFLARNQKPHPWTVTCLAVIAALFPSLVWAVFVKAYHIMHYKLDLPLHELMGRVLSPNVLFLQLAFKDLWMNGKNFVILGGYSWGLFILFSRRFLEAVPVFFLLLGVVLYYAYYYSYGSIGDHGSFLRYMMPAALPIIYLGSLGFNGLITVIEDSGMPPAFKAALILSFAGLFAYRLF